MACGGKRCHLQIVDRCDRHSSRPLAGPLKSFELMSVGLGCLCFLVVSSNCVSLTVERALLPRTTKVTVLRTLGSKAFMKRLPGIKFTIIVL